MLWNFWVRLNEFCGFNVVVVVVIMYVTTGELHAVLERTLNKD